MLKLDLLLKDFKISFGDRLLDLLNNLIEEVELAGELLGEDFDLFDLDFGLGFLSSVMPSCLSH